MRTLCPRLVEDVSAASAAYLYDVLPEILKLPATEQYKRLKELFETAFLAYAEEVRRRNKIEMN